MGYDMYRIRENGETEGYAEASLNGGYFRLNVWGMSDAREELHKIGIVREGAFPDPPASHDLADIDAWRIASHGGDGPGIPVHKFCSNDGWVVTPLEVRSGVKYADEHFPGWPDTLSPHVAEFVEWMEASDRGFEVW